MKSLVAHSVGYFRAVQSALAMCVTFRQLKLSTLSPLKWLFRGTMLQARGATRRSYRILSRDSSSLSHAFHYGMTPATAACVQWFFGACAPCLCATETRCRISSSSFDCFGEMLHVQPGQERALHCCHRSRSTLGPPYIPTTVDMNLAYNQ